MTSVAMASFLPPGHLLQVTDFLGLYEVAKRAVVRFRNPAGQIRTLKPMPAGREGQSSVKMS
jgi:hypothetical protein